ncbi:MAG: PepSY domain-containing protein [Hyphomonadaceae bacterium]|nr:PepSY domain-containing protein [Hyphomonadaceae bacterium]
MIRITRSRAIIAAAAIGSLAFATPALAQSNAGNDLALGQIESRLTSQGFRVLQIERDDGHYEVKALNASGQCVELDVSRRSGEILRTKSDDDCATGGRHHSSGNHHSSGDDDHGGRRGRDR